MQIIFDMEKYLFLTTCGDVKNPECIDKPLPLKEVYTGGVYSLRSELLHLITDKFYITSLMGVGIVDEDYISTYYDGDQSQLNKKSKDSEFISYHRKLFEERYPGVIDNVTKVVFLGNANYNDAIKSIFYDKDVVICMAQKLKSGSFRQILTKTIRILKGTDEVYKSKYYEYKGWLFEFRSTGKEKSNHLYEVVGDKYIEVNPFKSSVKFMSKFRELTGNLSTKEYINSVLPDSTFYELISPTVKRYLEEIIGLIPIEIDRDKIVAVDYISDGPYSEEFVKIIKDNVK